jgi:glycosyltransferase involved in cell wall biosynthesis
VNPSIQDALFRFGAVRVAASILLLLRSGFAFVSGRRYRAVDHLCTAVRIANPGILREFALRRVLRIARSIEAGGDNTLARDYLADPASKAMADLFALSGKGKADLFRDLIVLKSCTPDEKGVILLKYARTFSAVVALLDMPRLRERYTFVLEPCWAGYCDPSILMNIARGHPLVVMCFTDDDFRYIERVGAPLVPVRLGPADWVDADVFAPPQAGSKPYDLVMVANWGAHKRHAQLFRALQDVRDRDVRVLLCGFAWANRTADDIRREAAAHANPRVTVEIREKVPQTELAGYVSQSKVFVFLTRKEGDNKALVEAMFADVPSIVFDETIGGAGSRVNSSTGVFASDAELADKIVYMLDNYGKFSPRAWALSHTGSAVATRVLDELLGTVVRANGGRYVCGIVEKTNAPNLSYKDPQRRADFAADYEFIRSCQLASSRS